MNHTPGPWILVDDYNRDEAKSGCGSIYSDGGYFLATIEDAPEHQANARLIAAAPDLLKALKDLERAAQAALDCTDGSERGYLREEAAKARAAIAKAKAREAEGA